MRKKINSKKLVSQIEKKARDKLLNHGVVSFKDIQKLKFSKDVLRTILIIDDDEVIRLSLRRLFEKEGFRVLLASDATELSEILDDTAIDFLILDIGLPWLDGYEIAELIKGHEDTKHIPLIFISGHADEESMKKGFAIGADDFIKKPFDSDKLKKTVRTLLSLQEP